MTVAAAEAAIGLAIFLVNFTGRKTLNADELRALQG
jgi:NADH:ubiquinone oxidoreductase subunit K